MEMSEIYWKWREIGGNGWKFVEIYGNGWKKWGRNG